MASPSCMTNAMLQQASVMTAIIAKVTEAAFLSDIFVGGMMHLLKVLRINSCPAWLKFQ
jgi:hypothetical protein